MDDIQAERQSVPHSEPGAVITGGMVTSGLPAIASSFGFPGSPETSAMPSPMFWICAVTGGRRSPAAGLSRLAPLRSRGSAGPKLPVSAACARTCRQSSEPAESISRLHAQKKPRRARESATQMRLSTEVKPRRPWLLERTSESRTRSFSSP
eukprot:scaffold201033_cov30-Tisochrysis_lutea.AAC.5